MTSAPNVELAIALIDETVRMLTATIAIAEAVRNVTTRQLGPDRAANEAVATGRECLDALVALSNDAMTRYHAALADPLAAAALELEFIRIDHVAGLRKTRDAVAAGYERICAQVGIRPETGTLWN